jgi:hypothetical protein
MKLVPLRPSCRIDSSHIYTFSNGRCMRELLHSDSFSKQAKSQQSKSDMALYGGDTWQWKK